MAMGLTMLALTLAGVGAGVKAVGDLKAGKAAQKAGQAQQAASESQAQLSDFNAQVADLQAQDAIARGQVDEQRFRQGVRGMIGSQRSGIAASNVDVGYGSAVDVQADAAFLGELDALTIRNNAAMASWGYKVQAIDARQRAAITRKEGTAQQAAGNQANTTAKWNAAGTLLGTGGSLLEAKYGFSRKSA